MAIFETIGEVFGSIRRKKLITVLAGFGVFWGIFIFVVLLGVGNGFRAGVMSSFDVFAQKSLYVYGLIASENGRDIKKGEKVVFDDDYISAIKSHYGNRIKYISPIVSHSRAILSVGNEQMAHELTGVNSDYFKVNLLEVNDGGRVFNPMDVRQGRNVVIIGEGVELSLFKKRKAIGDNLVIDGAVYKVIGVLKSGNIMSMQERNSVYLPAKTLADNYLSGKKFSAFCMTLRSGTNVSNFETDLKSFLAFKSGFKHDDEHALYVANIEAQTAEFEKLFNGLEIFIWIIGICLLISGIVGICNIMLIIVKERTNEIGIRMSVGAMPGSIVSLVMTESLAVTFVSGAIGMLLGLGVLKIIDFVLKSFLESEIMSRTVTSGSAVIFALVTLTVSGILAGIFPAIKAAQIEPIDAIRYENRE